MTEEDIERLYRISAEKIADCTIARKRYCYDDIVWSDRLIGLKGARGIGKTTLLLQKIKESGGEASTTLYVSLDSIWLDAKDLYRLAEYHVQHNGTRMVLDEVHYLPDWQRVLKNIYDDFKELKIAYTGSSMLKIKASQGDLSRRLIDYEMSGLSFREFLGFEGVDAGPALSLADILHNHVEIARAFKKKFKVLPYFERYLEEGYYPFYQEEVSHYAERVVRSVNQTLESDWPSVENITAETVRKARKMLRILAELPPQTPKMNQLYEQLGTVRPQGLKILYALERAGLIKLLAADYESLENLSSPEKIYCENTNLMHALVPCADVGTVRETFFINQLSNGHRLTYPKRGDFMVDDIYLFEIGGKGKTFKQIADIPNSYVVNDGVDVGFGNKIPLWLFGFLY